MVPVLEVNLWGRTIGAAAMDTSGSFAVFQYDPDFAASGIEVAPLTMPLATRPYSFPQLPPETFRGLPGLLADSLPDRFGNTLIDAWIESRNAEGAQTGLDRLSYVGRRGMGALEYRPARGPRSSERTVEIEQLRRVASEVLTERERFVTSLRGKRISAGVRDILRIGTSAGGARAKAVVAWNRDTGEMRSGQVEAPEGFEHWIIKFDGVTGNRDREIEDPDGFGAIEYAYHLMATHAGVEMSECRLLEEAGRRHFMTRRFDRTEAGGKLHMQTLGALAHLDYNQPRVHSYEHVRATARRLHLPAPQREQLFLRMVFNIVARNQDDHVKNIAFLMDKTGTWSLAPAYDLTFAYNPGGPWTGAHQMSVNGKFDEIRFDDLRACAAEASLPRNLPRDALEAVWGAVRRWPEFAERAGVPEAQAEAIKGLHRMELANG